MVLVSQVCSSGYLNTISFFLFDQALLDLHFFPESQQWSDLVECGLERWGFHVKGEELQGMDAKRLPLMVSLTVLLTALMVLRALALKVRGPLGCTCCKFVRVSLDFFQYEQGIGVSGW